MSKELLNLFSEQEKQEIWLQVLRDTCGCSPGYDGNMPCDNGMLCDRCSAKSVQEEYHRRLRKELAIGGGN